MTRRDDVLVSEPAPAGDVLAARRRAKAYLTTVAAPPAIHRDALLLLTAAILVLESRVAPSPRPDEVFAFIADAADGGVCRSQLSASAMQFVQYVGAELTDLEFSCLAVLDACRQSARQPTAGPQLGVLELRPPPAPSRDSAGRQP
jgi:hypothetical protein